MPKTVTNQKFSINLLSQDEFSNSAAGKILLWALSIGRYIVVITELIVIISFLSRFKLDRDLTDLNESIEKQKAIIMSYGALESEFKEAQSQLEFISNASPKYDAAHTLKILSYTLPSDVKVDDLTIDPQGFSFKATSLSMAGFTQFIEALFRESSVSDVSLGAVETQDQGLIINFDAKVAYKE
jgi:hypothetical protein